ncbi:hypothetical protein QQM79_02045 [Marinobacteraceae bacterium S3BR75-40.1]
MRPDSLYFRITRYALMLLLVGSCGVAVAEEADGPPRRVHDPAYGAVLFEYYQGNAFEALTRLDVAQQRGGIEGHGDHPKLVEGGLMLAYGMRKEARKLFEQVLREQVSPLHRSQAWFYLGKVAYLEEDDAAAAESLGKVETPTLQAQAPELYQEWLYLQGQLALRHQPEKVPELIGKLPAASLWRAYLSYNQGLQWIKQGKTEAAVTQWKDLATALRQPVRDENELTDAQRETLALRDRVLLSLGQVQLQQGQPGKALDSLKQVGLKSVFSDRALFDFAVAAANNGEHGLALQALNTLQERPLFTPWLQQVPFARGYLYEQLERSQRAFETYKAAAAHYVAQKDELERRREQLDEQTVIQALQVQSARNRGLDLGDAQLPNDPYGRLRVEPADLNLAALLATEDFQLALRDLHELYKLQRSMHRWERQLDSFRVMLATREQQRTARIKATREALKEQNAAHWAEELAHYRQTINEALAREDAAFFMSDKQKAYQARIQSAQDILADLPGDASTAEQRRKLQRIKAYFDWWLADEYGVNRWAAQKQLNQLEAAMNEFGERHEVLKAEMASNDENEALAQRVNRNQARLEAVRSELDQALSQARDKLVGLVKDELRRQQQAVERFLLASRRAQARLADSLFRTGQGEQP